jgi:hypothetical protein
MIEGGVVVVAVEQEEVVHVAPEDECLVAWTVRRIASLAADEHARVGFAGGEALRLEPRIERALPPAPSLSHSIDGFLDAAHTRAAIAADARLAVDVDVSVAWRREAVDDFAIEKFALEVCGRKVPPPHGETKACACRREHSQRCGSHRAAPRLIVVYTRYLGAALYTQTRLELAAAFALVGPCELHEPAPRGFLDEVAVVDVRPAAVGTVSVQLDFLSGSPPIGVLQKGRATIKAWRGACRLPRTEGRLRPRACDCARG